MFQDIKLSDKKLFEKFEVNTIYYNWEFSFASLFIYKDILNPSIYHDVNTLFIKCIYRDIIYFYFLTLDNEVDLHIEFLLNHSKDIKGEFYVSLTNEQFDKLKNKDKYNINIDKGQSDYIYLAEDLKSLEGKKYHQKRNFISRFLNSYKANLTLYEESDKEQLLILLDKWYINHENDLTLREEKQAIINAINHLDLCKISLMKIEGIIIAFEIFTLEFGIAHILFEKGDLNYSGIYQTINYLTANTYLLNVTYINRQEDMGIEGLRQAKLSYHPVIIADRININLKN